MFLKEEGTKQVLNHMKVLRGLVDKKLSLSGGTMTGSLDLTHGGAINFLGSGHSNGEPPVILSNKNTGLDVKAYTGITLSVPYTAPGYVRFPVPSTASEGSYVETGTWTPTILVDGSENIPDVDGTPVLYVKSANYTKQGKLVILRTVISTEVSVSTSLSFSYIGILLTEGLPYTFQSEKFISSYAFNGNPRAEPNGVGRIHYSGSFIQFDSTSMPIGSGMTDISITMMYHI